MEGGNVLLTATVSYIQSEIMPVLAGIATGGIVVQVIRKGIKAQEDGISFTEFLLQVKKLILAGAIIITAASIVATIKIHYI